MQGYNVVGEILRPFNTALFAWWAGQTAWAAMDMIQALIYAEDAGEQHPWSFLLPTASGAIRFSDSQGAIPFPEALCIDQLNHQGATTFISSPVKRPWKALYFGWVEAKGSDHIDIDIKLNADDGEAGRWEGRDLRLGTITPFKIEFETSPAGFNLGQQMDWTQTVVSPLFPSEVTVSRWIGEQLQTTPEPPIDPCGANLTGEAIGKEIPPWMHINNLH